MSALQSSTGLSIDFSNLPAATAEASAAASPVGGTTRFRGIRRFRGCSSMLARRAAVGDYALDVEEGPVHREGQVFYRAAPTQKTHAVRSCHVLPLAVSRAFGKFVRRSTKAWVWSTVTSRAAYRALLVMDHCTPRDAAKLFEKPGGMNPSSSHLRRLLVTAGNLWKEKGEVALDTKAKPVPTGFFRCLARRGCASLQRARRSMLGVLRNGQFP